MGCSHAVRMVAAGSALDVIDSSTLREAYGHMLGSIQERDHTSASFALGLSVRQAPYEVTRDCTQERNHTNVVCVVERSHSQLAFVHTSRPIWVEQGTENLHIGLLFMMYNTDHNVTQ